MKRIARDTHARTRFRSHAFVIHEEQPFSVHSRIVFDDFSPSLHRTSLSLSLALVSLRIYHPRTVIWFIRAYFALAQRLSPNTRAYLADLSIGNSCIKGWDRSAAQAPPRNPILNFGPWLRLYFHYRRTAVLANILAHRWPEGNVLFFSFFFPTPSPQSDFVDRINRAKRRV